MNIKHTFFISGQYFDVWGPESRQHSLKLFLRQVANHYGKTFEEISFVTELMGEANFVHPKQAYYALGFVNSYIKCDKPIILKSDKFLSSSRLSLLPPVPEVPNKVILSPRGTTILAVLKDMVHQSNSGQNSPSVGTTSGLQENQSSLIQNLRNWWNLLYQKHTLQPQIILFLLVMATAFGCLALPLR